MRSMFREACAVLGSGAAAAVRDQVFAREGGRCRCAVDGYRFRWCSGVATDRHELRSRGAGGAISLENCVALCRACHSQITSVGAWLRLSGDANVPGGLVYAVQTTRRQRILAALAPPASPFAQQVPATEVPPR